MFDAYRKWLGIQPKDQPPNHYRLLSLDAYESDLDVIEGAADRAMGFIRQYQSGEHAALAAQLLNEIANARICLLKAELKAEYDAKLRRQLTNPEPATGNDEAFTFDPELAKAPALLRKPRRKKPKSTRRLWVGGGIGAMVCVLVVSQFPTTSTKPRMNTPADVPAATKSDVKPAPPKNSQPVVEKVVEKPIEKPVEAIVEKSAELPRSDAPFNGDVMLLVNDISGRCMTTNNGYHVTQGPFPDQAGAFERWKLVSVGNDFKLVHENSDKVLAVPASSKTPGISLVLWEDLNAEDQQWAFVKTGKHYAITSRTNGLAVGVAYSSKDVNAGVVQWPLTTAEDSDQVWQLRRVTQATDLPK